jgi:thymidylate synthase
MGLGVPFNIASYSLLTYMIASICDLEPWEFVHTIGDAHVYSNHIEPLTTQTARHPNPFPTLTVNPDIRSIDEFTVADFKLEHYAPQKRIDMALAV